MKSFGEWLKNSADTAGEVEVAEGVNPTDVDSVGKDQDLDNAGVPFDGEAIEKAAAVDRERDEIERAYQLKLHNLMQKKSAASDDDPAKGPEGQTTGGTIDKTIRKYLADKVAEMGKWQDRDNEARADVPVKATGTAFLKDPNHFFSRDEKDAGVDKHGPGADGSV